MVEYFIQTPAQLAPVLVGARKSKKLTQKSAGTLVSLLPKTISGLESAPEKSSLASLFKLLSALELEMVLRPKNQRGGSSQPEQW
jgi:HTH-type transcriptional regulator/antitoxin HipB